MQREVQGAFRGGLRDVYLRDVAVAGMSLMTVAMATVQWQRWQWWSLVATAFVAVNEVVATGELACWRAQRH